MTSPYCPLLWLFYRQFNRPCGVLPMTTVVDFEESEISKIRRLAADWQTARLQKYQCPNCDAKLNLIDDWKCGCCGTKNRQPDAGFWEKLTGSYIKTPMHTVLDGCLDKYCDFPRQAAVQCHSCSAYLVFDRSALMKKKGERTPVVAKKVTTRMILRTKACLAWR